MGVEAIAGIAVTVILAVVGWVWRLSWKLAIHEGKIEAAETMASNASAKATAIGKEVTDAINRLGDRLDNLFIHLMPKP